MELGLGLSWSFFCFVLVAFVFFLISSSVIFVYLFKNYLTCFEHQFSKEICFPSLSLATYSSLSLLVCSVKNLVRVEVWGPACVKWEFGWSSAVIQIDDDGARSVHGNNLYLMAFGFFPSFYPHPCRWPEKLQCLLG